jgi:hypothetical protein
MEGGMLIFLQLSHAMRTIDIRRLEVEWLE